MVPKPLSHPSLDMTPSEAVVIVTPYSTGCCIANEVQSRDYKVICLWSAGFSEVMKTHIPMSVRDTLQYDLVLDEQATLDETANLVLNEAHRCNMRVVSVLCGGEAGVDLADALSETLGLRTNGTLVKNRRDKKVQQELVKAAGLRSVRQAAGQEFSQVEEFLQTESYPVIVKPLDSAGSDGVKLCHSFQEAKEHFLHLVSDHAMINGGTCKEALCQEYLRGKEYVVDHVSRDGIHKTVMVWVYDKRPANGSTFVYFGDVPVDSESPEAKIIIPYVRGVLDALGIQNGPSHGEVIITQDGTPCLVEMNCRAHGGDGVWQPLCKALTGGYSQIDATVYSYLNEEEFDCLPDKPPSPFLAAGQCVDLVSYTSGIVKSTPGYNVMKLLPSFVCLNTVIKAGSKVSPTVDMATEAGNLVVMHPNEEILLRDIALIRHLETHNALFEFEPQEEKNETPKPHARPRSCSLGVSGQSTPIVSATRHHRIVSMADNSDIYNY